MVKITTQIGVHKYIYLFQYVDKVALYNKYIYINKQTQGH